MRKLRRSIARARMRKAGFRRINRVLRNYWRVMVGTPKPAANWQILASGFGGHLIRHALRRDTFPSMGRLFGRRGMRDPERDGAICADERRESGQAMLVPTSRRQTVVEPLNL